MMASGVRDTPNSEYRELSQLRKTCLLKLLEESDRLQNFIDIAKSDDVQTVRDIHKRWLNLYEQFLNENGQYQSLLSPESLEIDERELRKHRERFEAIKLKTYAWFTAYQPDDTQSRMSRLSWKSGSSRSSAMSRLSSKKFSEDTRKAELLARQEALIEERRLEEEKLKLRYKEEELKLKTELKVSDAKSKVLEDLERSMVHDYGLVHELNLKPEVRNPAVQNYEKTIGQDFQSIGLIEMTKQLNKPKVEIIKFQGNPMDYTRFIRQFETKVVQNCSSYEEKMNYMLQFTIGEPNKIATGYSYLNAVIGYNATLKEFKERYGDPDIVSNSYVKKALDWPNMKSDDPKSLDLFSIFLSECQYAVENVSAARVLDYQENIQRIVKKLPFPLQERFRNTVFNLKESNRHVTFEELVKFIKKESRKANDPIFGKTVLAAQPTPVSRPRPWNTQRKAFGTTSFANSSPSISTPKCEYCGKVHWLNSCIEIIKKTLKERYEALKYKGLCYSCLRKGHQKSDCRKKVTCNICQKIHPTILHVDRTQLPEETPTQPQGAIAPPQTTVTSGAISTGAGNKRVLPIVPVKIRQRGSDISVETYAFLDSGSNTTFCTDSLRNKLNVEGTKRNIYVQTLNGKHKQTSYSITNLQVSPIDSCDSVELDLPEIYTQQTLPVNLTDLITAAEMNTWSHLRNVPLYSINSEIELLIGVDVPKAMEPWDVVLSKNNGPFAVKTVLGWVINGPVCQEMSGENYDLKSSFIKVDQRLDDILLQQYNRDFNERVINDVAEYSEEDRQFMNIAESSVTKDNGHYVLNLPLKSSECKMPNNRVVASHRLALLKKRFENDSKLCEEYCKFMDKVIQMGYAKRVPEADVHPEGREWYLPHHPVRHPKKDIFFWCRDQDEVAIAGDIESMFYQVRVPQRDASLLKFLWFEGGDVNRKVVEYQMVVHLFGAKSSPSCANFALRKTAIDQRDNYDSQVVNTVLRNMYVDDCLKSVPNVEIAKSLVKGLQSLLLKGGFRIHKWLSSSREVMSTIPTNDRAVDLDLDHDMLPVDRALGIKWCVESDEFRYSINIKDKPFTRRGMLSMLSTVYDPLGFLAPLMLHAKNILKDLCRLGLGWDEQVPDEVVDRWTLWLNDMHKLSEFSVARCLVPAEFGEVKSATLHHFSDASEVGYGMVSYLRLTNNEDKVHCAFVMGKSRVAPMKQITVPRLELTAATVAVRTDKMLKSELDIVLKGSVFWSDSMAVLRYINNSSSRFQTFVANRLSVIHDGSTPDQWRYVNTKINPADIASRGVKVDDIVQCWIVAPDYLWKHESEWPEVQVVGPISNDDTEAKKVNVVKSVADNVLSISACEVLDKLMSYFSSWYKLKRAVAWILKVRKTLLEKVKAKKLSVASNKTNVSYVTVDDMKRSENVILRHTQRCAFPEETRSLDNGESKLKKTSVIRALDPIMEDGLIRVGGRLHESKMPEEAKHPVILPKNCEVSKLIIREYHEMLNHVGRNHTLSVLRERYWLINGPSAVRKLISKCLVCRRSSARVGEQKMSSLPKDRITPDEPCFTHVGVDYFGPFEVKQGRSLVKRYGVIFTCLASRAVHIEIAASLDTDSYINALRRFIARRGQVISFRSDNGSNFVGAEKEIRKSIQEWNVNTIESYLKQRSISWKFNPPAGSHHGGVWERLIRSIRQVLKCVLKQQTLTDESLSTLMCEVESILNSRPITRNSDRHDDLEALTPNHLLLLKRKPTLPPGLFAKTDNYVRRRWRQVQYLANLFWSRWTREYLPLLQERQKWHNPKRNLQLGDIVLVVDSSAPRNSWLMGKVIETIPDRLGFVRQVKLRTASNPCLVRPVDKLCLILEMES